jgi:deazaflavin-dependent oxidoreductase (nitroreductase family)
MPAKPRFIDPTRLPGRFRRAYAALAATRAARFISHHINWKLDVALLRLTGGRVATTLMFPTALLETRGAHTGAVRRNAVIYFRDGNRVIIAASNAGGARHPGWYHNLLAHPDVVFAGIPMKAAVADQAERNRLWDLAHRVFPAFVRYRHDAVTLGRQIPLVTLTPSTRGDVVAPP